MVKEEGREGENVERQGIVEQREGIPKLDYEGHPIRYRKEP